MDKNYKQRAKGFFKKEGFYIVLFLCLCITAIAATISFNKSNKLKETSEVENIQNEEETINSEEEEPEDVALENETTEMQNAERAENITESTEETKAVSTASTEVIFSKPVEGKVLRGYTYPKPVKFDETTQRTIRGIDIESKIGTEVKASAAT